MSFCDGLVKQGPEHIRKLHLQLYGLFSPETNSTKTSFPPMQLTWSTQTVSLPSLLVERSKAFWRGTQFWCECIPH